MTALQLFPMTEWATEEWLMKAASPWIEQFGEGLPWRGCNPAVAHMPEKAK